MLRQFVHGSLAMGEMVGHGLCGEARWSWLLILTGGVMTLVSAVGLAQRISEVLVCAQAGERR
jgi:hypothetical protein